MLRWYAYNVYMTFSDPVHNIDQLGVPPGAIVADFGTGSGFYAIAAAKKIESDGAVYAIDIQKDLLGRLKDHAQTEGVSGLIRTIHGDLDTPGGSKLDNETCDRVIIANVLFQAEDKQGLLTEAFRVLKERGKVLIVDWQDSYGGLGPAPEHILTEIEARELVQEAGFKVQENISAGAHHYGFVATKE